MLKGWPYSIITGGCSGNTQSVQVANLGTRDHPSLPALVFKPSPQKRIGQTGCLPGFREGSSQGKLQICPPLAPALRRSHACRSDRLRGFRTVEGDGAGAVDGWKFEKADVICVSDGIREVSPEARVEWAR